MKFEWDEKKRQANLIKHKLDFVDAENFFEQPAIINIDHRFNYGEIRYIGTSRIFDREVILVFSKPSADRIRIISFRKANKREIKYYYEYLKNKLA